MAQKALILLEAILGALAVLGLLLVGADAIRHALRGSDRKRRILEAGLAALVLLGLWPASLLAEEKPPGGARPPLPSGTIDSRDLELARALAPILEARDSWKDLVALRRELRGALPVDRDRGPEGLKDAERIRDRLDRSARLVDALEVEGALDRFAAGFLRRDVHELSRIAQRLSAKDPREDPYAEGLEAPVAANVRYLGEVLRLLEDLAFRTAVRPAVAEVVLETLGPRIAFLSEPRIEFGLTTEERNQARGLRASLQAVAQALRKPEVVPLERDPRWARFLATWEHAKRLDAGTAPWPRSRAEWEALVASLDEAERLLDRLAAAGRLGGAEAGLVLEEFRRDARKARSTAADVRGWRFRSVAVASSGPAEPAAPSRGGGQGARPAAGSGGRGLEGGSRPVAIAPCPQPTCYTPCSGVDTIDGSLERLKDRLALLERLAAQERVRPEVLLRVVGKLETDLDALARSPLHRDDEVVDRAKALLAKIKAK